MADVKRYDLQQPDSHMGSSHMQPEDYGDYVTYDDYAALRARLEAVGKERDNYQKGWSKAVDQLDVEYDRTESAEAALATARRDAWELIAMGKLADAALEEAEAILGGEYGDQYAPLCAQINDFRHRIRALASQEPAQDREVGE